MYCSAVLPKRHSECITADWKTGEWSIEHDITTYHNYRTQAVLKDSVPFEPSEPLQLVDRLLKSSEAEVLLRSTFCELPAALHACIKVVPGLTSRHLRVRSFRCFTSFRKVHVLESDICSRVRHKGWLLLSLICCNDMIHVPRHCEVVCVGYSRLSSFSALRRLLSCAGELCFG